MSGEFAKYSTDKIKENGQISHGFHVFLNYWEIKPNLYENKLHELALKGVKTVSVFVPWAHFEADITHSLKKFMHAAWNAKLKISLFVMPAAGVHYPNCGIPKDLLSNMSNLAVDKAGQVIYHRTSPNVFALPSFASPDVLKSFGNYLLKLSNLVIEVSKETRDSTFCQVVVSNALFNYYRSPGANADEHGDFSAAHVIAFRDFLDREYKSTNVEDTERFKMQFYERHNRHRFFTHVGKTLREKTEMIVARKQVSCVMREMDVLNPECAPDSANASLVAEVMDFHPSVTRFYNEILQASKRGEAVHFSSSGLFRKFTDQEKNFLLMAAFLHCAEVVVEAEEFYKLSAAFHRKRHAFTELFAKHGYHRELPVQYFSASKYSMESISSGMLTKLSAGQMQISDTIEGVNPSGRLIFCDPKSVVRMVELVQLMSAAQNGKVVAIPAPMKTVSNYMSDALMLLDRFKKTKSPIRMNLGVPYEVYEYGLGQVVLFDSSIFWDATLGVETDKMTLFFKALLGLADVHIPYTTNNEAIDVLGFIAREDSNQNLLCVMNSTDKPQQVHIRFTSEMLVRAVQLRGGAAHAAAEPAVTTELELDVPAYGVIPMYAMVAGTSFLGADEDRIVTKGGDHGIET